MNYELRKKAQTGDRVLAPLGEGRYLVGDVGAYYYEEHPKGACPYMHRRSVRWLDRVLLKEDMSTTLAYGLGALMTIFSIQKHAHELEALLAGERYTPAEKPQRIRDLVLSGLLELDGKEFEIIGDSHLFLSNIQKLMCVQKEMLKRVQHNRRRGGGIKGQMENRIRSLFLENRDSHLFMSNIQERHPWEHQSPDWRFEYSP